MKWLTAAEAVAALQVKPQTLYANVSRGRIRVKPDPQDSRKSLYSGADVARLSTRRAGRRSAAVVAAETIRWGDPVLSSGITAAAGGRLFYRGRDVLRWSETATFEHACALLWDVEQAVAFADPLPAPAPGATPLERALRVLARRAANDPPCSGRSHGVLTTEATDLVAAVVAALLGDRDATTMPVHQRMATAWSAPRAADLLRRSLVLLADHELNASTFAVRVAVSTGAPLSAGLIAGLATLAGPQHGGASAALQALVNAARRATTPSLAVRDWVAQGRPLPAFGHPLYPDGDPRAAALLEGFKPRAVYRELCAQVVALTGDLPNIDFALAAMADAQRLPPAAPFVTFAIARCAGWVAHALEQIASGEMIRPRARYVGVAPAS